MRKPLLLLVALLILAGTAMAQNYITPKAAKERKDEEMALAAKLLGEKDVNARAEIRKEMVKKDAILDDKTNQKLGDGYAVDALVWLYQQGMAKNDVLARLDAVVGLSQLETNSARDPVVKALDDPSEAIQLRAIHAVNKLGIVSAGKKVVEKLSSPNDDILTAAAKCLADLNFGGDGESTGPMIRTMTERMAALKALPLDDKAARESHQRVIEVMGRACGVLIPGMTWAPSQSMDSLEQEVAKFTKWWNDKKPG